MADEVQRVITEEMQQAKYFGLILDSTPDVAHVDQLTLVVRYVSRDDDAAALERFLGFVPIYSHNAQSLETVVLETFTKLGVGMSNYRRQSYDNASNMAGQ